MNEKKGPKSSIVRSVLSHGKTAMVFVLLTSLVMPSLWTALWAASSEERSFYKCYALLTGGRPSQSHALLAAVKNGTISAVDACMQVFDKAQLAGSGLTQAEASSAPSADIIEAKNVLSTFYAYHRKWFPSNNDSDALNIEFGALANASEDILDVSDAANDLTRILFSPSAQYKDLLSGVQGTKAIRNGSPANGLRSGAPASMIMHDYFGAGGLKPYNPALLETGELRGFRLLTTGELQAIAYASFRPDVCFSGPCGPEYTGLEIYYQKGYGGGRIGNPSYLILNMAYGYRVVGLLMRNYGGATLPRRWSKSVLKDFLCRDIPVIRGSDTLSYLQPASTNAFRSNPTCASCHVTIDGMSGVIRNLSIHTAADRRANMSAGQAESFLVGKHPSAQVTPAFRRSNDNYVVDDPSDVFTVDYNTNFLNRVPNGRFVYRNYRDELTDVPVVGLEELGQKLTEQDDFYVCAAKRYFEAFTGVSIPMVVDGLNLSEEAASTRQSVIQMGLDLKQSQNLRTLIRAILMSDAYKEVL